MSKKNFVSHRRLSLSNFTLLLTLIFLFLPLVVVAVFSFNGSKGMTWTGFSLRWYEQLFFSSPDLWRATWNSVLVALTSSVSATVIGTLAAIGLKWHSFRGKTYIAVTGYLPMVLPEVIIGISMLIFFSAVNIPLGRFTIYVAHTTFCLPFVFMLISARLDEFDYSTVEAARDLGATERQALTKVIIPSIMPGIASSMLISITMSLEDFVITFFVSGPGSGTLPLYVYSSIRYGVSPVINALSFVIVLFTMAVAFIFRRFLKTVASAA